MSAAGAAFTDAGRLSTAMRVFWGATSAGAAAVFDAASASASAVSTLVSGPSVVLAGVDSPAGSLAEPSAWAAASSASSVHPPVSNVVEGAAGGTAGFAGDLSRPPIDSIHSGSRMSGRGIVFFVAFVSPAGGSALGAEPVNTTAAAPATRKRTKRAREHRCMATGYPP